MTREQLIKLLEDTSPVRDPMAAAGLMERAAAALKGLPACVEAAREWIPCNERMPAEGQVVVTVCKALDGAQLRMVGHRNARIGWLLGCSEDVEVTHWLPIPNVPERVTSPQNIKEGKQ